MCGMFHRSHGFGFGSIECCIELCRGSGPGIFMMMRHESERLATTLLYNETISGHFNLDTDKTLMVLEKYFTSTMAILGINVTFKFRGCKLLVIGGADRRVDNLSRLCLDSKSHVVD